MDYRGGGGERFRRREVFERNRPRVAKRKNPNADSPVFAAWINTMAKTFQNQLMAILTSNTIACGNHGHILLSVIVVFTRLVKVIHEAI